MADIYLEDLSYYKPETDQLISDERAYVDQELPKKADLINVGAPSGIATLGPNGQHTTIETPWATNSEVFEGTAVDKVISPATFYYGIVTKTIPIEDLGQANGVCPLGSDTKVNPIYLPVAQNVNTYVVETLAERNALADIIEGDRCIVTNDPSDTGGDVNGEYVANITYPSSTDWSLLPNLSAVSSVNGQTGIVEITSIQQSVSNEASIATWATNSSNNSDAIDALDIRVGTNETDITSVEGSVGTLEGRVDVLEGGINANDDAIVSLDTRVSVLEVDQVFQPFYTYEKIIDTVIVDTDYQTIARLITPDQPSGTYEYKFSFTYTLDSITSSVFFRISTDGGSTWTEYKHEPKDTTDNIMVYYAYPTEHPGGIFDVMLQGAKEIANDEMNVPFADVIVERKL